MVARLKTVISGNLGSSSQEAFSCTVHWVLPGQDSTAITDAELGGLATSMLGQVSGNTAMMGWIGTGSSVTRCDAYVYGASGGAQRAVVATGGAGGTGTIVMPPQCSQVVSLLTGQAGASKRGRLYWPNLTKSPGTDLKLGSATALQLANAWASVLNGVVAGGSVSVQPVVYSPSTDTVTPVTSCRVGDVIDTQRRRRDALVETYQIASVS